MHDPFNPHGSLDIEFDTSSEDAEAWQDALKQNGDTSEVASERRAKLSRVRFFYIAIAGIFMLLLIRLLTLQIINSNENRALAEGNRIRESLVPAPRGVIYDGKRQMVARNVPNFEIVVTPSELPRKADERAAVYAKLAEVLKKSPQEIQTVAESKGLRYGQEILVADKLDRDTSVMVRLRAADLPGIYADNNPQRQYDKAYEFAHLLGYTGRVSEDDLKLNPDLKAADYIGKTGLESTYEEVLRGTAGKRRVEVNAGGQSIKELQSADPVPGRNLVLSIDPDLQRSMMAAADKGIRSSKKAATGGSAIALNPKNGEVLGMVSLPSFDSNKFINGIDEKSYRDLADSKQKPLFNRPISGEYPPGSTFKMVTATSALAEGVIAPNTYLSSPPELVIDGYRFPDWDPNGHGSVNVAGALAESSDVYFYKVAGGHGQQKGVGHEKIAAYMREFGMGKKSGIDLPQEKVGLVPDAKYKQDTFKEQWYIGDTYHMGIGQGFVLTTPLQVANMTAAIANNGIAYKPHLVRATENADNPADVSPTAPEQLINLKVDPAVIKSVQEGMRQAINSSTGTGRELQELPLDICGKTGSAEFANETNAHAWFTAYAPCVDPQIVITVMIEGGGEGSDVAVPAAKSILASFFKIPATPVTPASKPKETDAPVGRVKNSD